jgi:hypothetical protein
MNLERTKWGIFPAIRISPDEAFIDTDASDKLARIILKVQVERNIKDECHVLSDSIVYVVRPIGKVADPDSITDEDVIDVLMAIEDVLIEAGIQVNDPVTREPEPEKELSTGPILPEIEDEVDDDITSEGEDQPKEEEHTDAV